MTMLAAASNLARNRMMIILLFFYCLTLFGQAQTTISSDDFYQGIVDGRFDAVVDVRTTSEWLAGHIEGATFVEDLASDGNPDILRGCEQCLLVVYCRSGARAAAAIDRLQTEFGFQGQIFNGQGTSQWEASGYPLVMTESIIPSCAGSNICSAYQNKLSEPGRLRCMMRRLGCNE